MFGSAQQIQLVVVILASFSLSVSLVDANVAQSTSKVTAIKTPLIPSNPFEDFPQYLPSLPGCFNLSSCYQTNVTLDGLAAYFDRQLPVKYALRGVVSEPGRKIYKLFKAGVTRYLNLIFISPQQGTAYVLADQPLTLEELKTAVEVPHELLIILSQASGETAQEFDFADTRLFFTSLSHLGKDGSVLPPEFRPGIVDNPTVALGKTPQELITSLLPKLQPVFNVIRVQDYGGGPVYKLKKNNFSGYINLIPRRDGSGTIIVLWSSPPN